MAQGANAREAILDAAEAVVIESGAGHLTLAAVAAKAGVSKGGLLYHFPSKEDLLKGMLDRLIQRFDQARKEKAEGLKREAGAQIKATILTYAEGDARKEKIGSALLAAGAHAPKLLQPAREDFRRRLEEFMRSGLSFQRAAILFFAFYGLVFSDLLSLSPLKPQERQAFLRELLALTKP